MLLYIQAFMLLVRRAQAFMLSRPWQRNAMQLSFMADGCLEVLRALLLLVWATMLVHPHRWICTHYATDPE